MVVCSCFLSLLLSRRYLVLTDHFLQSFMHILLSVELTHNMAHVAAQYIGEQRCNGPHRHLSWSNEKLQALSCLGVGVYDASYNYYQGLRGHSKKKSGADQKSPCALESPHWRSYTPYASQATVISISICKLRVCGDTLVRLLGGTTSNAAIRVHSVIFGPRPIFFAVAS